MLLKTDCKYLPCRGKQQKSVPFISNGGARQNSGFVVFTVLRNYDHPRGCQKFCHGLVHLYSGFFWVPWYCWYSFYQNFGSRQFSWIDFLMDGSYVLALMHTHRPSCLFNGDINTLKPENFGKNSLRSKTSKVNGSSCPVENNSL